MPPRTLARANRRAAPALFGGATAWYFTEAAQFPMCDAVVKRIPLAALPKETVLMSRPFMCRPSLHAP